MHQYKGRMLLHTGSMFSGKTSSLERDIKRFKIAGYNTVVFKPSLDNRTNADRVVTHDDTSMEAIVVENIGDIITYLEGKNIHVLGIDEIQFLGGTVNEIIEGLNYLVFDGYTIVMAGLDMDFEGRPFEIVKELMPRADYLEKHHAVCARCGVDAWISNRTTKDRERVVIGATEKYEPLCRSCYAKERFNKEVDRDTK